MGSEQKVRLAGAHHPNHTDVAGGVHVSNRNLYSVDVTVRRVAEPWTREARLIDSGHGVWFAACDLRGAGYHDGQRVRVTVEPLE